MSVVWAKQFLHVRHSRHVPALNRTVLSHFFGRLGCKLGPRKFLWGFWQNAGSTGLQKERFQCTSQLQPARLVIINLANVEVDLVPLIAHGPLKNPIEFFRAIGFKSQIAPLEKLLLPRQLPHVVPTRRALWAIPALALAKGLPKLIVATGTRKL